MACCHLACLHHRKDDLLALMSGEVKHCDRRLTALTDGSVQSPCTRESQAPDGGSEASGPCKHFQEDLFLKWFPGYAPLQSCKGCRKRRAGLQGRVDRGAGQDGLWQRKTLRLQDLYIFYGKGVELCYTESDSDQSIALPRHCAVIASVSIELKRAAEIMNSAIDRTAGHILHYSALGIFHPTAPTLKAADCNDDIGKSSIGAVTVHHSLAVHEERDGAENRFRATLSDELNKNSGGQGKNPCVMQKP